MSVASGCACALLRSTAIAAVAVVAASGVRALLAASSSRVARWAWFLHLLTYLTPVVLVGYAYSTFALSLIHYPVCNELTYDLLVCVKLAPLATLVLWFAPSPISPEGTHCFRLLAKKRPAVFAGRCEGRTAVVGFSVEMSPLSRIAFWLRGAGRAVAGGFLVVFLLAFGEFELATFFRIPTWTATLFDAHVGGLALPESLRLALPAVACEGAVLLVVLGLVVSSRSGVRAANRARTMNHPTRAAAWGCLLAALAAGSVVPVLIVLSRVLTGLSYLAETSALARDIAGSVYFAAMAAACVYLAAGLVRRGVSACVWSLPGLLGPLVLSLLILALFQLPGLREVYDTSVPLLIALVALLFPIAWVLRALLGALKPGEAVHAAVLLTGGRGSGRAVSGHTGRLSRSFALPRTSGAPSVAVRARGVLWELEGKGRFWAIFLLFWWGYFDLTASHILAPSRVTPVLVRLYNFMHYGHSEALSAMVCVAFAVPFLVLAAAAGVRRLAERFGL